MKKDYVLIGLVVILSVLLSLNDTYAQVQPQDQARISDQDSWFDEDPNNIEETLIDFTRFEENIQASGLYVESHDLRTKNMADLTREDLDPETLQPAHKLQASDFYYDKWRVDFNASANEIANRRNSYTKKVKLAKLYEGGQTEANRPAQGTGETVLGVRIHFPTHNHNAYAVIRPPMELRTYNDNGRVISTKKEGKSIGVIDNVGTIKRISLDVSGRNYMKGIGIRLKDHFDNVKEYFMGYTYFTNWRRLNWINHEYLDQVNYQALFRVPIYPTVVPHKKFDSLVVYRPGNEVGGDFVVYFRKIDMWFNYAVPPQVYKDIDINDELQWRILSEKAQKIQKQKESQQRERLILFQQAGILQASSKPEAENATK